MVIFHSYVSHYQRVSKNWWPMSHGSPDLIHISMVPMVQWQGHPMLPPGVRLGAALLEEQDGTFRDFGRVKGGVPAQKWQKNTEIMG